MSQWFRNLFRISAISTNPILSNYDKLTRPQLIARIKTLEHQINKSSSAHKPKIGQGKRPFDIHQYGERRIALKVAYLGWNYSGFATQNDAIATPTVEDQLFRALESCKLIASPDQCHFTRCGRTDKGVSGVGQVVALNVRSNNKKGAVDTKEKSLPYIEIINRLLPEDIRILAWAPVAPTFNARFDCKSRTYKYFFEKGSLDLELMRQAASYMLGKHDFRNFCRLDPSKNITNYERTVVSLDIKPIAGDNFYEVELKGTAFLWHQVRCIMAIMFLVGQRSESPEVVKDLLNIEKVSARPDYPMASDLPLMLYDCEFEDINWIYANDNENSSGREQTIPTPLRIHRHFHELWSSHVVKGLLYKTCLQQLESLPIRFPQGVSSIKDGMFAHGPEKSSVLLGAGKAIRTNHYKKLLDRPRADSDEVKKEKYRLKKLRKQEN